MGSERPKIKVVAQKKKIQTAIGSLTVQSKEPTIAYSCAIGRRGCDKPRNPTSQRPYAGGLLQGRPLAGAKHQRTKLAILKARGLLPRLYDVQWKTSLICSVSMGQPMVNWASLSPQPPPSPPVSICRHVIEESMSHTASVLPHIIGSEYLALLEREIPSWVVHLWFLPIGGRTGFTLEAILDQNP